VNQQPLRVESTRPSWRGLPHRSSPERNCPAVVLISWASSASDEQAVFGASQIELRAKAEPGPSLATETAWTCGQNLESGWLDAIAASHCPELLLTASVDESGAAKQLVLELAGLLTRRLEGSRPLVRVRFLPRPIERRRARRDRL
jgi:hypothetical protein